MRRPGPRGACPSLDAPMQTGDGLLVRLAPADGSFTPAALAVVAEAADKCGNGIVEVSNRGNLQIRGLTETSHRIFGQRVLAAGIEPRAGIAIDCNPMAGIDPAMAADPRPLVAAIRTRVAGLAVSLAPKVSVIVDGGGAVSLGSIVADVRLVAATDGVEWHVAVGGTAASARSIGRLPAEKAVDFAIALLQRIAAKGSSARGRDLSVADLENVVGPVAAPMRNAASVRETVLPVGRISLTDSRIALGLAPAFGAATAGALGRLCAAAVDAGVDRIVPAPGKALLLTTLAPDDASALERRAAADGFIHDPTDARLSIVACSGAPACASGLLDTRRLGAELVHACGDRLDGRLRVHVSGCAKRCADPGRPVLEIVGDGALCRIAVAGTEPSHVAPSSICGEVRRLLSGQCDEAPEILQSGALRHAG